MQVADFFGWTVLEGDAAVAAGLVRRYRRGFEKVRVCEGAGSTAG